MGSLFGGSKSSSSTPTSFKSLPQEAQAAFQRALERGEELSLNESLFTQPGITSQQQGALNTLQNLSSPISAGQFQQGLQTFYNPYEEQVVENSIGDIRREGQGILSDIGSGASEAGGFGGTRQALLESQLNENILRSIGDVSARTRSAGFENAANRILQDLGRSQQATQGLFNASDLQRQIDASNQQAPIQAVNYLLGLAQGFPTGGGSVSKSRDWGDGVFGSLFPQGIGGGGLPIPGIGG